MSHPYEADVAAISKIDAVENILNVVCRITGLGFSAVARVTESHWIACAVRDEINFGLKPGGELGVGTTICNEIRQSGKLVVIDHVENDPLFREHATPKQYGFQSYISVPIRLANGQFFGTLCAIDPRPAKLNNPETVEMFKLFADMIAMHLDAQDRVLISETALFNEREASHLREQFVAVLGHDLRNPLSAISCSVQLLAMKPQDEETAELLAMMHHSVKRMDSLIGNVLDFARGRLGGGLGVRRRVDPKLVSELEQVVTELQTGWPDATIHSELAVAHPVNCDAMRISQMLSNLISNALVHGDISKPVRVRARTDVNSFEINVANSGSTLDTDLRELLFKPFTRGTKKRGETGLGLGLYIASEIAKGHSGTLTVDSQNGETTFIFRMPIGVTQSP